MPETTERKSRGVSDTKRIKMLTSQAGYLQVPVMKDGKPVFEKNGKPRMENGTIFQRARGKEYDVPTDEADRLIATGQAEEV